MAMKKHVVIVAMGFVVTILITSLVLAEGKKSLVKYPKDYRNWTHIKSMVIQQGHSLYESFGGIHHIYANEKALKAMKSGKLYPDGAVLVFDLLEAKNDNNGP